MTQTTLKQVNYAVLVGILDLRKRDRDRRSALNATVTATRMQILTPFGEPFDVPLTLAGVVEHGYKLDAHGKKVAVEGYVRLERGFDRRFAHEGQARGTPTRAMQFVVTHVRDATADEPAGSSFVALRGTVLDPPRFVGHPHMPDTRLALVRLGITHERPSPYPGSAIVRRERYQVNVAVSTEDEHAAFVYQPGNEVQIEGELDCVLVEQRDLRPEQHAVQQRAQAAWEDAQQQFRTDPRAEREAYNRYLGQLQRLTTTPMWRVLAGHIAPIGDAQPMSQSKAQRMRRAWGRGRTGRDSLVEPRPVQESVAMLSQTSELLPEAEHTADPSDRA